MRLRLLFAVLACLLTPGAAGAAPAVIRLKPYVGRLVSVDAMIAGRPARLLFDTGAGLTSVTPRFARAIGCRPRGRIVARRMTGEPAYFARCGRRTLAVDGFAGPVDLMVFDLDAVLPRDLPPLDGVLGLDAFTGQAVTVDLARSELTVESRQSLARRVRGLAQGVMRRRHESGAAGLTVLLRARADRGVLWLLADSANLDHVRLAAAVRHRLKPGAGAAGPFTFDLQLDGLTPAPVEATIAELIHDGALNQAFFATRPITFDLARDRVWYGPLR